MKNFIHLHLHSHYSLLDGMIKIPDLIKKAKEFKMPALAITDHGNIFGAIEFYQLAKKERIKPIIGCEIYVANGSHYQKKKVDKHSKIYFHLVLLVQDLEGYYNLIKILSIAYKEGFYYRPRIDRDSLKKYSKGLIALSGCLGGEIPYFLLKESVEDSFINNLVEDYAQIFLDRFYLEVQDHNISDQKVLNKKLYKISKQFNLPMVATNDVHYLNKEDAMAHQVLISIASQSKLDEVKSRKSLSFAEEEFYFKSYDEMFAIFSYDPTLLENSIKIASECNLELKFKSNFPKYISYKKQDKTSYEFLEYLCKEGLKDRYRKKDLAIQQEASDRLEKELQVIKSMKFEDYFLVVWDLVTFAKQEKKIPVGPGRGSVVGSIVAYVLYITEIDPIKYHLIFERFLNPERISMPDIDIDFSDERREELIHYLMDRYGKEKVANIVTFGSLKARAVIRDVARVLNIPLIKVDAIVKEIPSTFDITLKEALRKSKKLEEYYSQEEYKDLFKFAEKLEGVYRHVSTHAAGLVISSKDLSDIVPLYLDTKTKSVSIQYEGKYLEYCKILKLDLLGLKNLNVLHRTVEEIEKQKGHKLNIYELDLQDSKTYELLKTAQSKGVFQVESIGMQKLLKRFAPNSFEDIIALIALYRPGPLDSGMMEEYIERKNNIKKREEGLLKIFPQLKMVLQETYGIIVYQEQIMEIAKILAGFSMGEADVLRKIIGKKDSKEMEKLKNHFIQKVMDNTKISRDLATDVFSQIETFGRYGFNKSHSTAYALITYQTAYLKVHYPKEYLLSLFNADKENYTKLLDYMQEARNMNISILPPSVQKGEILFTLSNEGQIRYGLIGIKNLGIQFLNVLIQEREKGGLFKDLEDFLLRINFCRHKKYFEILIKAGALDELYTSRAFLLENYEILIQIIEKKLKEQEEQIFNFSLFSEEKKVNYFDIFLQEKAKNYSPNIKDYEILNFEKELLGVHLSANPLDNYKQVMVDLNLTQSSFNNIEENQNVSFMGYLKAYKKSVSKQGNYWIQAFLESFDFNAELLFFKTFAKDFEAIHDSLSKGENKESISLLWISGILKSMDPIKVIVSKYCFPLSKEQKIYGDKSLNKSYNYYNASSFQKDQKEELKNTLKNTNGELQNDLQKFIPNLDPKEENYYNDKWFLTIEIHENYIFNELNTFFKDLIKQLSIDENSIEKKKDFIVFHQKQMDSEKKVSATKIKLVQSEINKEKINDLRFLMNYKLIKSFSLVNEKDLM